jgi:hypothetical protein
MNEFRAWRRDAANEWPCKRDCPDRKQGCHAICKKYEDAKKENDKKKAEIRSRRVAEQIVTEYVTRRVSESSGKPLKQR